MAKVGFVFSGASARIAQLAALAEALIEGYTPSQRKVRPDVMAGASAGSLNAVAVNAILKTKDGKATPKHAYTWDDYKELLFALKDSDVFDTTPRGILRIPTVNIPSGYVLDTAPLRRLLKKMLRRLGIKTLGELYLPTYLSVIERKTGRTYRLSSRNPAHAKIPILDALMASTAIPVAFPPQRITGFMSGKRFIDGATGRDIIPVEAMRKERCDDIYVISRMRVDKNFEQKTGLKLPMPKILENALLAFDTIGDDLFGCEIDRAVTLARKRAFLYMPKLDKEYPLFSFSTQKEQYEKTTAWARKHDPEKIGKETIRRLLLPW